MSIVLDRPSPEFIEIATHLCEVLEYLEQKFDGFETASHNNGSHINWYFQKDDREIVITVREYKLDDEEN